MVGPSMCDIMAQAVNAIATRARMMARKRSMNFQRKVASSAYIAEREGRAIVDGGTEMGYGNKATGLGGSCWRGTG